MSGDARSARSFGVYWPAVVPQSQLLHKVVLEDGRSLDITLPPCEPLRAREATAVAADFTEDADARMISLGRIANARSEEHTSELQSLMRISYAVFCLKKKKADTSAIVYHPD